jgi:Flp pilus assembly protein TadG
MKNKFKSFLNHTRGAAGIEMALIFPFMIFLYFGLADLTGLVSLNRKVTYASDVMSDLITRSDDAILKAQIADFYNASDLIMAPRNPSTVRIENYGYRISGSTVSQVWKTNNGNGTSCGNDPDMTTMPGLMTVKNDLIVTRVCTTYTPYVATFLGQSILGASTFKVMKTVMRRPRSTLQLTCYQTVLNGAKCS